MRHELHGLRQVRSLTTGERIRLRREARGMSRPVLAGLVGRSADWLKKVETGVRQLNSLTLLVEVARALGVEDLSEITGGDTSAPVCTWSTEVHHVVPEIRRSLTTVSFDALTKESMAPALSAEDLGHRVTRLWRLWHSATMQRSEVGVALPFLIRQAHASVRAADGNSRRSCRAATADLYRLVQRLLAHICEPELHALAVERGRAFSEEADTPGSLAEAAWASSVDLCAAGHFGDAASLAVRGAETLVDVYGEMLPSSAAGTLGALQLEAAAAHGLAGNEGSAYHYLDAAAETARTLPYPEWHLPSAFDRANVAIIGVIVGVGLHRDSESIKRAQRIDLSSVRSVVRRSRLLLECANAQAGRREFDEAVRSLHAAVRTSPEAVALIPWARVLADELAMKVSGAARTAAEDVVATMKAVH